MAPSRREWLPKDHFAWFVLAAVAELDLSAFFAAYRLLYAPLARDRRRP